MATILLTVRSSEDQVVHRSEKPEENHQQMEQITIVFSNFPGSVMLKLKPSETQVIVKHVHTTFVLNAPYVAC